MTILAVIKDVCTAVGVLQPTSIFSGIAANRTMQEMLSVANEMAQRIAYDARDWTELRKVQTYSGNGVTTAWDLPANYKRMLLTSNVWRSSYQTAPMLFIPDTDTWINRRNSSWTSLGRGEWTIYGGQIHIVPALAVGETAYFVYLDKNCVALNGSGFGDSFSNDLDAFVMDERLLRLGITWQWKAQKGSQYAEDMATWTDAMAVAMGSDAPAPIIIGGRPASASPDVIFQAAVPS